MKKYTKGEIAKIVLAACAAGAITLIAITMPGIGPMFKLFMPRKTYEKKQLQQSFKKLVNGGYLRIDTDPKGRKVIVVTEKGNKRLVKTQVDDLYIKKAKSWDGKWRLVIFDIPEEKKIARNAMTQKLKSLGMYSLQRSTFVFPYKCKEEVDFIATYYNVSDCVYFIEAQKIENDQLIKNHFQC